MIQSIASSDTTGNVMEQLKQSTAELHRHAEMRPLQRAMIKAALPRETFAAYLAQLLLVHRALEIALTDARQLEPQYAALFQDDQRREPNLIADLAYYGIDPAAIEPVPATQAILEQIHRAAQCDPVSLFGMLYVLEGSNNGSKFIARAISRATGVQPGEPGLCYLDPYGSQQMERWQAFKRDMNAAGFSATQVNSIIGAAKAMFVAVADISDEVYGLAAVA